MEIGKKIKDIRLSKGHTEQFVAERAGIDTETYIDIEEGKIDLTFNQLENIARALEYEVTDVINHHEQSKGIRNYFYNHNGNSGTNIHVQGVDQEQIKNVYRDLYREQLERIPKLEKLLQDNNVKFNF